MIYAILTKAGSILLGKGGGHRFNKWCTSRTDCENKFDIYNEESDLFVVVFENGKRFKFDVDRSTNKIMNLTNEKDENVLDNESSDPKDESYSKIIRSSNTLNGILSQFDNV